MQIVQHGPSTIDAIVLCLPLFLFLPELIRLAKKVDSDSAIEAFEVNEQVKKALEPLFVAMFWLVLTRVMDPGTHSRLALASIDLCGSNKVSWTEPLSPFPFRDSKKTR
jgi:hypothetical protein